MAGSGEKREIQLNRRLNQFQQVKLYGAFIVRHAMEKRDLETAAKQLS